MFLNSRSRSNDQMPRSRVHHEGLEGKLTEKGHWARRWYSSLGNAVTTLDLQGAALEMRSGKEVGPELGRDQ